MIAGRYVLSIVSYDQLPPQQQQQQQQHQINNNITNNNHDNTSTTFCESSSSFVHHCLSFMYHRDHSSSLWYSCCYWCKRRAFYTPFLIVGYQDLIVAFTTPPYYHMLNFKFHRIHSLVPNLSFCRDIDCYIDSLRLAQ